MVDGAVRVERLGSSSVTWGLAIFRQGEDEAAAQGSWTHVFVDPQTTRPTPIPDDLRAALERYTA
jgi:acyl-CoA thioester hydrolase